MSSLNHQESMETFFDRCVFPKTSLQQFISKYESTLPSKYEKELQLDIDSLQRSPQLISKFYMEDQLRNIYTVDIFKKFQEEVKSILYCISLPIGVDGPVSVFEVKEPVNMEDISLMENKTCEVTYNSNEQEVRCICCLFQFQGILCRHALSVLNLLGIYEIPAQYIVERWRKDFKNIRAQICSSKVVTNGPLERYENLHNCCLKFAEVGAMADESYEYALRMISEVTEELIVYGYSNSTRQPKTRSSSTKNCKRNMRNGNDESQHVVQRRHNGRPIKMRKETLLEGITKTSQNTAPLRKPVPGIHNDVLRITPYATELDTHIWTEEHENINLAKEVGPTDLSIGSYFGVQLNHQHVIDNHSGRQWSFQQMLQKAPVPVAPPGPWAG